MSNESITNLRDPVNDQDATNKQWVDQHFLQKKGDTMSGNIDMQGYSIGNVGAPSLA